MKLTLYGNTSIQELQKQAHEHFSPIVNRNVKVPEYVEHPFPKGQMGRLYKVHPVKDNDQLFLNWVIDYQKDNYKNNPANHLSYLMAHEGEHSLLSRLIDLGYARELSAYSSDEMNLFTSFNVLISLTKKGMEHYEKVAEEVFAYIRMLKESPSAQHQRIFEEIKALNKVLFYL